MNFGFAGVSGTGKTTLFNLIGTVFGNEIYGLPEVTVEDVKKRFGMEYVDFNSSQDNLLTNLRLLTMQATAERNMSGVSIVADSPSIVKMMFYLFLASQFENPDCVDALVRDTIERTTRTYDLLFYLPFDPARERLRPHPFKSKWMLQSMDAILRELLYSSGLEETVAIVTLPPIEDGDREKCMFEELRKRGLRAEEVRSIG